MKTHSEQTDLIKRLFNAARAKRPAYGELYPILEPLFLMQAKVKETIVVDPVPMTTELAQVKWESGFPLLLRWDFPVDARAAGSILAGMEDQIPADNQSLIVAHRALSEALRRQPHQQEAVWSSFLHHEMEPWEEWVNVEGVDIASLLFWARSCLRPSLEWTAERLVKDFPVPSSWLKGYCPVCGSLPSLLFLEGEGKRKAHCSWCSTQWDLHRLQCPYCDNRDPQSLGYLYIDSEPHQRVQYCQACTMYFKVLDAREHLELPYFSLEEWTTLHLDLVAQHAGWKQPLSPSPIVYGGETSEEDSNEPQ